MPRASNGTYTLPAGNPVVTGSTIASSWANTTLTDIATEMTDSLDRSGKGPMLAALQLADGSSGAPGLTFGSDNTLGLYKSAAGTIALNGKIVINAATASSSLTVEATDGVVGLDLDTSNASTSGTFMVFSSQGTPRGYIGFGPALFSGGSIGNFGIAAAVGPLKLSANGGASTQVSISTGGVTIAAPVGGVSLVVNAVSTSYAIEAIGASTTGGSLGLLVQAGTNSGDVALTVSNHALTTNYFQIRGDGLIFGGGPTAGALVDMTPDSGSWSTTLSGIFAANPSGTLFWTKMGKMVAIYATANIQATTNASGNITASGLPAEITPSGTRGAMAYPLNNGGTITGGPMLVLSNNTLQFGAGISGVFSSGVTAGIQSGMCFVYSL